MARIPLFQQQQLASSRVGIPQDNNAGQQMAASLLANTQAQAAGGLKNYTALATEQNQVAQQNTNFAVQQQAQAVHGLQQNLNNLRAEHNDRVELQRKTEAAAKAKLDDLDYMKLKSEYGVHVNNLKNDIMTEYADRPEVGASVFKKKADDLLNGMVNDKSNGYNDSVKQRALGASYSDVEAAGKTLGDWTFKRRSEMHLANAKETADQLSDTSKIGSVDQLLEQWQQAGKQRDVWKETFGPVTADKMLKDTVEKSSKNFLEKMAMEDPEAAQKAVKDGIFDGILNEKEKAGYLKDAAQQVEANRKEAVHTEAIADTKLTLNLMAIERSADMDPHDPMFMKASIGARDQLRKMEAAESQQAEPSVKLLKTLRTAIDKQDAQIEKGRALVKAGQADDDRRAAKADRVEAKAERLSDKEAAFRDAMQAKADAQSAKIWKEQAQAKYNSEPARASRIAVDKALYDLKNPDIHGIHRGDQSNKDANKRAAMPELTDFQLFNKVRQATELLEKAHNDGHLSIPGQSDRFYEDHMAYLQSVTERLQSKQQAPTQPSGIEMFWKAKIQTAPEAITKTFGEYPETHKAYFDKVDAEVSVFTKQNHGQRPTAEQIEKYIRPVAARKMLMGK